MSRISTTPRRAKTATVAVFACLVVCGVALNHRRVDAQGQRAVPPIAIDATDEQIKQVVGAVRAGRKLTPAAWPNGGRVAVALSFDIDNELLMRQNPLPVPLSEGEYGATTALPRILAMLERQQVPASF